VPIVFPIMMIHLHKDNQMPFLEGKMPKNVEIFKTQLPMSEHNRFATDS
jgi:hypothetical protein